jgi:hypothetical protein
LKFDPRQRWPMWFWSVGVARDSRPGMVGL